VYHHQVNKKVLQILPDKSEMETKYGHLLPSKTIMSNPWECLWVDLICPYTFKGKDNSHIDFMALTMIDPASSWVEIAELPVITQFCKQTVNGKELLTADKIFDKILDRY
jgi:hypothetical protein